MNAGTLYRLQGVAWKLFFVIYLDDPLVCRAIVVNLGHLLLQSADLLPQHLVLLLQLVVLGRCSAEIYVLFLDLCCQLGRLSGAGLLQGLECVLCLFAADLCLDSWRKSVKRGQGRGWPARSVDRRGLPG